LLAEAVAILSADHCEYSLHCVALYSAYSSPAQKASVLPLAVLKKYDIISEDVPYGFQSKYYFQNGEGKYYTRNLKYQTWLNRKDLLLALYRIYLWSLANQVEADARCTLPPALSDLGKFICHCWFDCAGGGKNIDIAADTLGNGIGHLIMQYRGGFDASKSHFALRGKSEYGKLPDNSPRCSNCLLEKKKSKALMSCASCRRVRYCGKECQVADWKRHKKCCKEWTEERKKKGGGGGEKKKKKG
jgi:hypothetical protein